MAGEKKKVPVKLILIVAGIVLFIVLLVVANFYQKGKENQDVDPTDADGNIIITDAEGNEVVQTTLSDADAEQQAFIEQWGEPPAGFRWGDDQKLIPLSDSSLTAEQVAYQYLRALSVLDMSTAEKYSSNSRVLSTYNQYFDTEDDKSYYTQFQRKLYKSTLTSIEVEKADDKAVFASGKTIITFDITLLDLTYKDFWKSNKEEIFRNLRIYNSTEQDNVKSEQYIYDEILKYFTSVDAKKRTIQIDLVLEKLTKGGWLVTGDSDLTMACEYREGTTVYEYINEEYENWLDDKIEEEERAAEQADQANQE